MRVEMAKKGFLSWVGFSGDQPASADQSAAPSATTGALDRIRELESQLADLRSRKDITSLTREEFEILATETAMNLVKTAQQRERVASSQAAKLLADSSRIAQEATAGAEAKAKSILSTAESRGRKYLEAAESESNEKKTAAERAARSLTEAAKREAETLRATTASEIESMLAAKKREAGAITAAAKHEAEGLIAEATSNIGEYRTWLTSAVAESERLYKIQTQSLSAAQQAIEQSRQRLAHAFDRLAALDTDIESNVDSENKPVTKVFTRAAAIKNSEEVPAEKKTTPKKVVSKKAAVKKVAAKKVAKSSPKKSVKKPVKKAAAKKSSKR
jgi:hypothetical protein